MAQSYGGVGKVKFSKSVGSLDLEMSRPPLQLMSLAQMATLQQKTHACYGAVNFHIIYIYPTTYAKLL